MSVRRENKDLLRSRNFFFPKGFEVKLATEAGLEEKLMMQNDYDLFGSHVLP